MAAASARQPVLWRSAFRNSVWVALVLMITLSMCLVVLGEGDAAASVMDKDGDGKVSTEEFVEHAVEQQKDECCAADGSCKAQEEPDEAEPAKLRGSQEAQQQEAEQQADAEAEAALAQAQYLAAKEEIKKSMQGGVPIEMSSDNAAALLDGTYNLFLKFSTSWCGHCVKMAPDWKGLAKDVHKDYKGCLVVSVDCEKEAQLCQAFSVQGYPTLILLRRAKTPEGETAYEPVKYEQARERGAMLSFLREKKAAKAKNWLLATLKSIFASVFNIQVQMPK